MLPITKRASTMRAYFTCVEVTPENGFFACDADAVLGATVVSGVAIGTGGLAGGPGGLGVLGMADRILSATGHAGARQILPDRKCRQGPNPLESYTRTISSKGSDTLRSLPA